MLLPVDLSESQVEELKEALIPGLPDFEWTVEWNAYIEDPDNMEKKDAVKKSLKDMLSMMISMPEYQLI